MRDNFTAFLTCDGRIVPGSLRRGHNLLTNYGRESWLRYLVAWQSLGQAAVDDASYTNSRIRYIGVGTGTQPATPHVSALKTPAIIDSQGLGTDYLELLDITATYLTKPVVSALKYQHIFGTGDLVDPITVTEAGLFVSAKDGSGLDPTVGTHSPVLYKRLDPPLTKDGTEQLTIWWELRF